MKIEITLEQLNTLLERQASKTKHQIINRIAAMEQRTLAMDPDPDPEPNSDLYTSFCRETEQFLAKTLTKDAILTIEELHIS